MNVTSFALVTVTSVVLVGAVIDVRKLKVPNWLTFPFIVSGLLYNTLICGVDGLLESFLGLATGLALLLVPYAIGGMGAGDVKLMGGIGAWLGPVPTFKIFCLSALAGGLIALMLVLFRCIRKRSMLPVRHAWERFQRLGYEVVVIRNLAKLSALARKRKKAALLLPYALPIAAGTFVYVGFMPFLT